MTSRAQIPPILKGEEQTVAFDFTSRLAVGETISTQVVAATVFSGTDASPSSLISGSASASGARVTQLIDASTGGVEGVVYELAATITTSAGQTLKSCGYLVIPPDLE